MAARTRTGCEPCCIEQPGCSPYVEGGPCVGEDLGDGKFDGRGCAKCLPRYRCAEITFTPSAYSELCPSVSHAKLFYACEDTWASQDEASAVTVTVQLYRQSTTYACECVYRVTVAAGGESELTEGIDPDDLESLIYSIETEEGSYEVTLSRAGVVANPLAEKHCATCVCATCLPQSLLVEVTAADGCFTTKTQCELATWDCDAYTPVTVETDIGDVTIRIGPADDGSCSLKMSVDAIPYTLLADGYEAIIALEVGPEADCSPVTQFRCLDLPTGANEGIFIGTRGNGTCSGESKVPQISEFYNIPAIEAGEPVTIAIRDGTCGDCSSSGTGGRCPGDCIGIPLMWSPGTECAPPNLTATFIHADCEYINGKSFTMKPSSTTGTIGTANIERTPCSFESTNGSSSLVNITIVCEPSFTVTALLDYIVPVCVGNVQQDVGRYVLHLETISGGTNPLGGFPNPKYTYLVLSPDETTSMCNPFILEFVLPPWDTFHNGYACSCADEDFRIRITL